MDKISTRRRRPSESRGQIYRIDRDRNFLETVIALAILLALLASVGCNSAKRVEGTAGRKAGSLAKSAPSTRATLANVKFATAQNAAAATVGKIEPVALFYGAMPTGVTVSRSGRIFVNFPRWGDEVAFTVSEIKDGLPVAYPNAKINRLDLNSAADSFISVQSVVIDPRDRLWILDTGSINLGPIVERGPKLVCVDLGTNQIIQKIQFPPDVVFKSTYLNDVRFDLTRGSAGMAFITDSSAEGANGIIVVDLQSGKSWRKLNDHPSTKADKNFMPTVEGRPLARQFPGGSPAPITIGSDGIAISSDGKRLFYCPLGSRRLHSVSIDALADAGTTPAAVAATVKDLGPRDFASDGLESDAAGNLYLTDYEHNAIRLRTPDGQMKIIAQDARMIWPDTLSVAADGYLYFIANQLNRQSPYHQGKDLRQKPYVLFRTHIDGAPVQLK